MNRSKEMLDAEYTRLYRELEEFSHNGIRVPAHDHRGIAAYILEGVAPGGFLQGIITCDLRKVMWHADEQNQKALAAVYSFFYNRAPSRCWGSLEAMQDWVKKFD